MWTFIEKVKRFTKIFFFDQDVSEPWKKNIIKTSEYTSPASDESQAEWDNGAHDTPLSSSNIVINTDTFPKNLDKVRPKTTIKETTTTNQKKREDAIILWVNQDMSDTVRIMNSDMKRHVLVVWSTWSGKTSLLERMIVQDIEAGRWVWLIDPHGDLYEAILSQIPKSRSNDVVLFDLTDVEYPIWFNILENTLSQFPSLIASSLVGVFKKIFGYSWWPRLEYILRNATLTLLEKEWSTLLDLTLLLTDENFRRKYIAKISNPFLEKFWNDEFDAQSNSKQSEIVSPILNKVWQFLSIPLIRNIVSQPKSGFSPRWIMDNKKIFLANLSKGKIWGDTSEMFGSLLVSKFHLDAMSRATIDPEMREPFQLYVDEFQSFATDSFSDILSESRKFSLWLVIAHQYTKQVSPQMMDAVLWNVWNIISFRVNSSDAHLLAPNMSHDLAPHILVEQPLYNFTLKTNLGGKNIIQHWELIHPESIWVKSWNQKKEVIQSMVREKFAKDRSFVEEKLTNKMQL